MVQPENTLWADKIHRFSRVNVALKPPVSESVIRNAESSLGVQLPEDLRSLLKESNGLRGQYDLGLVWPIERIVKDNLDFRQNVDFPNLYMPFNHLLFFADAGNGDQFAFAILAGEIRQPDIYVWNHENDGRSWIAPNLSLYLEWWLSGKIKI